MSRALDVLIVGGGPVGLVTALHCRRAGLSVEVLDRRGGVLDKPCGEGLLPPALRALDRLGITLSCGHEIDGILYAQEDPRTRAMGRFRRAGRGVRRTELHAALRRAAQRDGVVLRQEDFRRLRRQGRWSVVTASRTIAPRFVVGADGLRSAVRRAAGLEGGDGGRPRRFGVRGHFARSPWSSLVEVHWSAGAEAYVTPVGPEEVGVALLWWDDAPALQQRTGPLFQHLLQRFPPLHERLGETEASSRPTGCGPLRQRARDVVSGNLALVGDAAGYVDAVTGEGLAVGFEQAELLAAALRRDDLPRYRRGLRRSRRTPDAMTRWALLLSRRPSLRRRVLSALARRPASFTELLDTLAGTRPLTAAVWTCLRLGLASLRPLTKNTLARSESR